eukprot:Hpha_TRINITY_DN8773_c0_g1::TRINITY_DN8773_c0_g1_i2::g.45139::m.45139
MLLSKSANEDSGSSFSPFLPERKKTGKVNGWSSLPSPASAPTSPFPIPLAFLYLCCLSSTSPLWCVFVLWHCSLASNEKTGGPTPPLLQMILSLRTHREGRDIYISVDKNGKQNGGLRFTHSARLLHFSFRKTFIPGGAYPVFRIPSKCKQLTRPSLSLTRKKARFSPLPHGVDSFNPAAIIPPLKTELLSVPTVPTVPIEGDVNCRGCWSAENCIEGPEVGRVRAVRAEPAKAESPVPSSPRVSTDAGPRPSRYSCNLACKSLSRRLTVSGLSTLVVTK